MEEHAQTLRTLGSLVCDEIEEAIGELQANAQPHAHAQARPLSNARAQCREQEHRAQRTT
eukprot:2567915-Alexandrium_andersonii.AAC.1